MLYNLQSLLQKIYYKLRYKLNDNSGKAICVRNTSRAVDDELLELVVKEAIRDEENPVVVVGEIGVKRKIMYRMRQVLASSGKEKDWLSHYNRLQRVVLLPDANLSGYRYIYVAHMTSYQLSSIILDNPSLKIKNGFYFY
jgi:hypothetical protein